MVIRLNAPAGQGLCDLFIWIGLQKQGLYNPDRRSHLGLQGHDSPLFGLAVYLVICPDVHVIRIRQELAVKVRRLTPVSSR